MKINLLRVAVFGSIYAYALLLIGQDVNYLALAQVAGLMGLTFLFWQVVLGFRGTARLFTRDLQYLNGMHQFLGKYGFVVLLAHFGLILASSAYGLDLILSTDISNELVLNVKYGLIALDLALIIWLSSAFLRKKLSWDWWKRIHLLAYAVIGLAFLHSGAIGTTLNTNSFIRGLWYAQTGIFALIVLWRFANWIGLTKLAYRVDAIEDVAKGVKQFTLVPQGKAIAINPKKGQFAYFQFARFKQAHPFTVSHYSEDTRAISFSIKNVGDYTNDLHNKLQRGDEVYIDGPYGVFTKQVADSPRKSVFIAGGIGITPFLRHISSSKRVEHLFWGCQTVEDLAYGRDIKRSKTSVTIALSSEERKGYESGYISLDLLNSKLKDQLEQYDFYICGPPPMMNSLEAALTEAGVTKNQINTERFSL